MYPSPLPVRLVSPTEAKVTSQRDHFFGDTEKVKRFLLMNHEWSIQSGELTPTLKLKRNVLIKKYEEQIEKLFT